MVTEFAARGWLRFGPDEALANWVRHALPAARKAAKDPRFSQWHECEGTWFVGLDALENDETGRIDGSGPLAGNAVNFLTEIYGPLSPLHRAQLSIVYPGYPRPRTGEGEGAFRYRQNRDAAHVDGLIPEGPLRQRRIGEPHMWILGIPLTEADANASPLVVWEGSHSIMRQGFERALVSVPKGKLGQADVTDAYQEARRYVFDHCRRITLPAQPGEAVLLHRHMLHGVAPWASDARADPDGRMIAYFRPQMKQVSDWLATDTEPTH